MSRVAAFAALLALGLSATPATRAGDAAAAARQYKVARRLAAEGSPDAASALRKVVELDPGGDLSDDALLEQALLKPVPRWPEELGGIDSASAARSLALLTQVVDEVARGDRLPEARYRRGLLQLEPIPQHDPSLARIDLLTVATTPDAGAWADAARYAVAWLAEQQGRVQRARFAYHRLIVDGSDPAATARARLGLSRLDLRDGNYGQAAERLYEVERNERSARESSEALKELAVRSLLAGGGAPDAQVIASALAVRSLAGFAVTDNGGALLGDQKGNAVLLLDASGEEEARWELPDVQWVGLSPLGRAILAAGDRFYRLEPDQEPIAIAAQGDFVAPASLTLDGLGRIWLLDRRGTSVGRIDPGENLPRAVWEGSGVKLVALRWDGRRLLALDARSRSVVVLAEDGTRKFLAGRELQRPVALATDPTGRIAVLDDKAGAVALFDAAGTSLGRFDCAAAGIDRPSAVDFGRDGSLHVFDESNTSWVRFR